MPEQHDAPARQGATAAGHGWGLQETVCAAWSDSGAARARRQTTDANADLDRAQLQACQYYLSTIPDGSGGAGSTPRWRGDGTWGNDVEAHDMAAPHNKAHEHANGVPCHWSGPSGAKVQQAHDFLREWGMLADCCLAPALERGREGLNTVQSEQAQTLEQYSQTLA